MPSRPRGGSEKVIKNGSINNGKPKFSCRECRRQFVENPSNKTIPKEAWDFADKLLPEKISAAGTSEFWIQQYTNKKYEDIPKKICAFFKKSSLILEWR